MAKDPRREDVNFHGKAFEQVFVYSKAEIWTYPDIAAIITVGVKTNKEYHRVLAESGISKCVTNLKEAGFVREVGKLKSNKRIKTWQRIKDFPGQQGIPVPAEPELIQVGELKLTPGQLGMALRGVLNHSEYQIKSQKKRINELVEDNNRLTSYLERIKNAVASAMA